MPSPLRLMAIFAHPDDESLGLGGTLVQCAQRGIETFVVTATRGERGRFRELRGGDGHPGPEALGRLRETELKAAAAVLGVREVRVLGYPDSGLDQVDSREAVARLAFLLRLSRPQVVVTFAPDGAYGHPDHIAISQFATAAAMAAADPAHPGIEEAARVEIGAASDAAPTPHAVSKLYYLAWPKPAWDAYQAAFKTLTSTVDGVVRQATPWPDWALTTVVDAREHWPTVWKAVQCHDSQMASYQRLADLSPEHHEGLWGWQSFYRVFSTVNGGRRRESDLFEGLSG